MLGCRPMRRFFLSAPPFAGALGVVAYGAMSVAAPEPQLVHEWRIIGGHHWQIVSPPGEDPATTDAAEGTRGACGAGMVEVRSKMKVTVLGDEMQQSVCTKWINRDFPER